MLNEKIQNKNLGKVLGQWLHGMEVWSLYGTFTFHYAVKSAHNAIRYVRNFIKRELGEKASYFLVAEPFADKHAMHIHGLIGGADDLGMPNLSAEWRKNYGRCRIEKYDREKGAAYYVSKYIHEDFCEWDISIDPCLKARG